MAHGPRLPTQQALPHILPHILLTPHPYRPPHAPAIMLYCCTAPRYRNQYSSDAMVQELASSQDVFAPALLETQKRLTAQLATTQVDKKYCHIMLRYSTSCCTVWCYAGHHAGAHTDRTATLLNHLRIGAESVLLFTTTAKLWPHDGMDMGSSAFQGALDSPSICIWQDHGSALLSSGCNSGCAPAQDPATLKLLLSSVRLSFRIFFSLNAPGLTPVRGSSLLCANMARIACHDASGSVDATCAPQLFRASCLTTIVHLIARVPRCILCAPQLFEGQLDPGHVCMSQV